MSDVTSRVRVGTRRLAVMLIAITCVLTACGQKGKLYLPNQKKQVPPVTQPDSAPQPNTQAPPLPAPDAR
jgi:predicted small lipoprotein YifL